MGFDLSPLIAVLMSKLSFAMIKTSVTLLLIALGVVALVAICACGLRLLSDDTGPGPALMSRTGHTGPALPDTWLAVSSAAGFDTNSCESVNIGIDVTACPPPPPPSLSSGDPDDSGSNTSPRRLSAGLPLDEEVAQAPHLFSIFHMDTESDVWTECELSDPGMARVETA